MRPELGPWPLLLIALGLAARGLSGVPLRFRLTPFDVPVALLALAALVAANLAYAPGPAWEKFWVLVGGIALYAAFVRAPVIDTFAARSAHGRGASLLRPSLVALILALLPLVIAVYFVLTNDWLHWQGKLPALDPAMRRLADWQAALASGQPHLSVHRLHPNVAGGLLAVLLPLQLAAVLSAAAHLRASLRREVALLFAAPVALVLVLTGSRGAWLGLLAGAAAWIAVAAGRRVLAGPHRLRRAVVAVPLLALVLAAVGVRAALAGPAGVLGDALGRFTLLRSSLDLALDTPFTGLGLNTFQMAYSSYVLILHVGYQVHSHNLLVNLWLELGALGLLAFGWLLVAALRAAWLGRSSWTRFGAAFLPAAAVSLMVLLVHGMVDDVFFGSRGLLLLLVPFALLARELPSGRFWPSWAPAVAGIALVLALALALLPASRAAFNANLGALSQARAELSVYEWPRYPIQDALRRALPAAPPPVDLGPAVARYRAALALDPANVTANRRLGQIELSQGDYVSAAQHLEAAYAAAPAQFATRLLLGEVRAIEGRTDEAAVLWRGLAVSSGQLDGRAWWHGALGEDEAVGRMRSARGQAGL